MKLTTKTIDYTIPDVATLASLVGVENQVTVLTEVGREGTFIYRAANVAVNNGGTIFNGWTRDYSGALNVRWFGAVGDNSNDDTTAIQATITQALSDGNIVEIPNGTYKTTATIQIANTVSIKGISGRGWASSTYPVVINYNGAGVAIQCYSFNTPYLNGFDAIEISGIYLKDVLGTGTIGFDLQGFRWSTLKNCAVGGFAQGLHTWQSWFGIFDSLFFSSWRDKAIYAEGLDNNTTWNNIKIGDADASATSEGILWFGMTSAVISALDSESNAGGIKLDNCKSVTLDGLYYETSSASESYALLLADCHGTTINAPYIDGNTVVANGINNGTSTTGTSIIGGYIIDCTIPVADSSFGKEISIQSLDTDIPLVYGGSKFGARKIGWTRWTSAPTAPTGAWNTGDMVWNDAPTAGSPTGWICVVSGTPGIWVAFGHSVLDGSTTFDPASLVAHSGTGGTLAVTGAALGDFVEVSFSLNLQNITLTGYVASANVVAFRFHNGSGATVDLASGTLRARVKK